MIPYEPNEVTVVVFISHADRFSHLSHLSWVVQLAVPSRHMKFTFQALQGVQEILLFCQVSVLHYYKIGLCGSVLGANLFELCLLIFDAPF